MDLGHDGCVLEAPALQVLINRLNDAAEKSPYVQSRKMTETRDNGKCHAQ